MKQCRQCRDPQGRPIHGYCSFRDRLFRRAGGCNWLDGMVLDGRCPHCGGPLVEVATVTPIGRAMDEMSHGIDWTGP